VSDGSGAKLASLLAGQKAEGEGKKSFAMAEGEQTVFTLRDYVFDRVNKNPADFWEKPAEKKDTPPAPSSESSTEEKEWESEEEEIGD
jgi:hypothetical protein